MTHPPGGPHTPPPPGGPRKPVQPIDPSSEGGRAAAEALSQVLAEITVAAAQRRAAREQGAVAA